MSRQIMPFGLRMPDHLRAALESSAKEAGRSLNTEIVRRLLQTFEETDMPAGEEEGLAQFKIRLPSDLLKAIKVIAKSNKRSVGAQIELILNEFVATYQEDSE
ncbi:Arc family DNA-binding protein [Stenotrophomonas maltophilia]|uniref:Arc family DNA-binding protein n=1 Tax=Stenotrophomonas maltophilia TaxID=40324 RepID=UPI003BF82085